MAGLCVKSHTTMQAEQLQVMRQRLDETQEVLQREQHRVQLLETELLHLRSAQSACLYRRSGAYASVSEVRHICKPLLTMGYAWDKHGFHEGQEIWGTLSQQRPWTWMVTRATGWVSGTHLRKFSPWGGVR